MPDTPRKPHHRQNTLIYHKPGCQCRPCRGKAKALAGGAGAGGSDVGPPAPEIKPEDIVHADGLPPILYPDHSARARVVEIVAKRRRGLNLKEIAEEMGLTHATVRGCIYRAAKEGWLKYEDPYERFSQEIIPKVVDNIDYWIKRKDKTMTIEAAKGGGVFRSHQAVHIDGDSPQTVLNLKIETVAPLAIGEPKVVTGHIVGTPKRLSSGSVDQ